MNSARVLHLEDNAIDAEIVSHTLRRGGISAELVHAKSSKEYMDAITSCRYDVILADNGVPGFTGMAALEVARQRCPETPFICVSGFGDEDHVRACIEAGASDFIVKDQLWQLVGSVKHALEAREFRRRNEELERRVNEAAAQLKTARQELENFTYSVSHDLRAPLRAIAAFTEIVAKEASDRLLDPEQDYLVRIRSEAKRMWTLLDDLVRLTQVTRGDLILRRLNLAAMAKEVMANLRRSDPERVVDFVIPEHLEVEADSRLAQVVLENLLSNAWKFTSKTSSARIELGGSGQDDGNWVFVRDNGAGFDMRFAHKLFAPFQRLHLEEDYAGSGIGLAAVQRIIQRHGGKIWAEAGVDRGATFYFTFQA